MAAGSKLWLAVAVSAAALSTSAVIAQGTGMFGGKGDSDIEVFGTPDDRNVRKATAIVNGDVITDTDVEHRLNLVLAANQGGQISPEERARLRVQVLRNLIDEKLQVQEAKAQEIVVPGEEIDQAFARVAANFRQTPSQFEAYLQKNNTSSNTLKQQIGAELHWSRVLRRKVEPMVNVGDDEVQAIIDKLKAAKGQDEYRIGEIFLSATPATQAQALDGAARIAEQVRGGASFVAYARQFSEASTAAVGGDLGWVRPAQLSAPVQAALQNLQKGQVSDPVVVPGGVTLVTIIDKRQVLAANPDDALLSLKQISIKLKPGMTQAEGRKLVDAMREKTASMGGCGRAEEVAAELGADVVANDQIPLRELPPQLQEILRNLQIGESTPPFGSAQEGIRVLVLCGRDDPQQNEGPSFDQVYSQLNEQRIGMMAQRYLRDLRRDAIIDYR